MGRRRHRAPAPLETAIQAAVLEHWLLCGVPGSLVAAIPNAFAHGQPGLTKGLADLMVIAPSLGRVTGYIELKRDRSVPLTYEQGAFANLCLLRGIPHAVCYGRDEPIKVLEAWGVIRPARAAA